MNFLKRELSALMASQWEVIRCRIAADLWVVGGSLPSWRGDVTALPAFSVGGLAGLVSYSDAMAPAHRLQRQ